MKIITSRSNPLCVHLRKLASSRSYREETGEFLCDSPKLLREAALWGADVTALLCTEGVELPQGLENRIPQAARTGESVMRSVSPMEAPQGALFTARCPGGALPKALSGRRYLALEGVQDPGNVGTIVRTADAFEADGVFLLPGCADLWNPKTVRSSMGAVFRLPAWSCGLCRLRELAEPLAGSALREDTPDLREADLRRAVILVGSEGRGLSGAALALCAQTVRIPMGPRCESLNAAVAAAVLLWEGYRRTG